MWGKKNDSDFRKFGFRGYKRNLIFSFSGGGFAFILQGLSNSIFVVILSRALFGFFLGGIIAGFWGLRVGFFLSGFIAFASVPLVLKITKRD